MEFWFDFASTYSYPAAMRIEALAAERNVTLTWKPILLGPVFKSIGWESSPFVDQPIKQRYMWRDVERICASLNLPFKRPSAFPRTSLLAARIACRFADEPWAPAFVRNVFSANFEKDLDIGDRAVITACLAAAGVDAEGIIAQAQSDASKLALRQATERAQQTGIFGAPSFVVEGELFWGNDRLLMVLDWAAGRRLNSGHP